MALLSDITVNGRVIPAATIALEAQNHPAPRGKPGAAWMAAARALALREILVQKARALGLVPAPQEVAPGQMETDDEALIRQVLEASVAPEPVDEASLRAFYDADPGRFRAPPLWEAAHILIPAAPGDGTARQAARALAERLIAELAACPERFAALAAEHSACDSRRAGGSLGQIGPGDTVPEFEAVLRSLPVGAIAPEPVESRFGFHVLRLDARAEGAVLPFAAVAPRLRAAAEKAAWVRAARAFADRLAAEASVTGIRLAGA
ncbi:peptidylprolyl isomerase [Paracoccus bogoriensis]|uniref:peptidylprolyl isomerase n=1 Tax=Paracoccus bogoriensis TaxID=242065 RepID=UPI001C66CBED|nr:peptidylprolyl isomerase [Paracoccus bogoriensis]MBW7057613.1 peptidylprolyl isomerase [Paracoccus bogoriensis]